MSRVASDANGQFIGIYLNVGGKIRRFRLPIREAEMLSDGIARQVLDEALGRLMTRADVIERMSRG